jgi:hypothetical protein
MALALFVGTSVSDRVYIMPWIWTKYAVIFIQIMRFTSLVVELAASQKNPAGASPIFELLFLGECRSRPWSHFIRLSSL